MAKCKRQMAKLRSRKRCLPFDICHLNFDLFALAGGGSGMLPPQRASRLRYLGSNAPSTFRKAPMISLSSFSVRQDGMGTSMLRSKRLSALGHAPLL